MSFFYVHVTRKKTAKMTFVWKIRTFNVDEIDTWKHVSAFSKLEYNSDKTFLYAACSESLILVIYHSTLSPVFAI